MSWGAQLIGVGSMLDAIDDIQVRLTDDAVYVVGTNVSYSIYVEFGTSRMEAQPYLIPAAREVKGELSQIAANKNSLEAVVKAAALEIERRAAENAPVDTGNLQASIKAERVN